MYLWGRSAGCTAGTVWGANGTVIRLRTRMHMRRKARQEKLLRQKSSLMMYLRYCYVRDWFKFLFGWISTGCIDSYMRFRELSGYPTNRK